MAMPDNHTPLRFKTTENDLIYTGEYSDGFFHSSDHLPFKQEYMTASPIAQWFYKDNVPWWEYVPRKERDDHTR